MIGAPHPGHGWQEGRPQSRPPVASAPWRPAPKPPVFRNPGPMKPDRAANAQRQASAFDALAQKLAAARQQMGGRQNGRARY